MIHGGRIICAYSKLQFKMKKKTAPKSQFKQLKTEQNEKEIVEKEEEQIEDIALRPRLIRNNLALYVSFSGTIESGSFDNFKAITLHFSIVSGPDWKKLIGKTTGETQIGSCDHEKIVWNFPFEVSYETTVLGGWPQLLVVLYGTDFFGKPYVQGYGNIHLPTSGGIQKRRMRVFCPKPRSVISGMLGYIQGYIAQYVDFEKVLSSGDGRQVTRTKSVGYIDLKLETSKYNFKKYGYE